MYEPAQSKCILTFYKSHFIRKFTDKRPQPKDHTLQCEAAQSKCYSFFQKTTSYRNFQVKGRSPEPIGPHSARACAIEMHVSIISEGLIIRNFTGNQKAADQSDRPDQAPAFERNVDVH